MSEQETTTSATETTLAPRPVQDEAWVARALSLASETALPVDVFGRLPCGHHGEVDSYSVPSKRESDKHYTVEIVCETGEAWCGCTANFYGRPCSHVGAVLAYRAQEAQAKRKGRDCPECGGLGYFGNIAVGIQECSTCDGSGWLWLPE